jgi:hypothetical protein
VNYELPSDVIEAASLTGNEYGWTVASFPDALAKAEAHGYACLGGQFQFRVPDGGTCEMYWLSADSHDRVEGESWADYSHPSCSETLAAFRRRIAETDFGKEAASWPLPTNPERDLVFVAYFVTEADLAELVAQKTL